MARVCEACGKNKSAGNEVTFSHRGIRRSWSPNLRRVRIYDENGTPSRKYVCTRCLRSGAVNRSKPVGEFFLEEEVVGEVQENTEEVSLEENSTKAEETAVTE